MKLSTKIRYGTRLMLDLARHNNEGYVHLKDTAKRQEVSVKYLEQLVTSLRAKGLVRSLTGPQGGYCLVQRPSQIKLNQIVQALEGSISLVECVNNPELCHRVDYCATYEIWKKMTKAMNNLLESTTLDDLAREESRKLKRQARRRRK
jgi:Rrf2 family protein